MIQDMGFEIIHGTCFLSLKIQTKLSNVYKNLLKKYEYTEWIWYTTRAMYRCISCSETYNDIRIIKSCCLVLLGF